MSLHLKDLKRPMYEVHGNKRIFKSKILVNLKKKRWPISGGTGLFAVAGKRIPERVLSIPVAEEKWVKQKHPDFHSFMGLPQPPPPGVSTRSRWPVAACQQYLAASGVPSHRLRPGRALPPPRRPQGA